MGRTSLKYTEELKRNAIYLAEKGCIDEEICKALGISEASYYKYKKEHKDFEDGIQEARFKVNLDIEAALFKRAIGYEVEEQEVIANVTKTGEKVSKVKKTKKHIPGDTKLLTLLLKNRMPEKYRNIDKQEIELNGNLNHTISLKDLSDEELLNELQKLEEK